MPILKPCPFCGSEAVEYQDYRHSVNCNVCGAFGPDHGGLTPGIKMDNCIEAWNERAKTCDNYVKMRLLEIDISCSDRRVSEIVGIDNYDNDVPSRCVIDLNRVSSVWASPDEGICIHLGSHEESYWTKTYTLSEFTALWRGSEVGAAIPSPLPPPTKKAADV